MPFSPLTVLGIETSCDETAAAVIRGHPDGAREILSNLVLSQIEEHRPYGGVVPEIAARAHILTLDRLIASAVEKAGCGWEGLDGVAATAGPGLIGGVMVGLVTGKAIAAARAIPLVAVNHLEGHALSVRLVEAAAFPYLLLLVSGGHCQLLQVNGVGAYVRLGGSLDDAAGEAFDKIAKLLGLGYPGGPAIEQAALTGDPKRFALPRPMLGRPGCDFSFSGLKTAVRHMTGGLGALDARDRSDMAASFQASVTECVVDRCRNAMALFRANCTLIESDLRPPPNLPLQGGGAKGGLPLQATPKRSFSFAQASAGGGGRLPQIPPSPCKGEGWGEGQMINLNAKRSSAAGAPRGGHTLVVAGGVAANQALRRALSQLCGEMNFRLAAPPLHLCTDNAAMIGWAGIERLALGLSDALDAPPRARWPLDAPRDST